MISLTAALEESFFLGLRLTRGVNLKELSAMFGDPAVREFDFAIRDSLDEGLLQQSEDCIRLTPRGRLFSNEVFQRFLLPESATPRPIALAR